MTLTLDFTVARNLAVAALAGLAVGIEREWSEHGAGVAPRFAGARTFMLLGVLGGIAAWLTGGGAVSLGAVVFAGATLLVVAAYVMAARRGPAAVTGTTEVAALAVLALGAAAGLGFPLLTSAAASLMVLALAEKTRIHHFITRIGEPEMTAALQFAVLALVILPLLPEGPYGPFASVRPRALWTVVLLLSGLNFAGYLARRAVGATRGYGVIGLLGGLVSSTAVTLGFARRSRETPALGPALALGAVAACTALLPKVLVIATMLNPVVGRAAAAPLAPALLVGGGAVSLGLLRRPHDGSAGPDELASPLGLWSAIKMAVAFQAVLLLVAFLQNSWGAAGVLVSAIGVGVMDMDALVVSMARVGEAPGAVAMAGRGIAVGALASTLFKLGLALGLGAGTFRWRAAAGLATLAAALGLGLWLAG